MTQGIVPQGAFTISQKGSRHGKTGLKPLVQSDLDLPKGRLKKDNQAKPQHVEWKMQFTSCDARSYKYLCEAITYEADSRRSRLKPQILGKSLHTP